MADEEKEKVEKVDKVEQAREILESLTNRFGCRQDLEDLAMKMASMHRTLVQSFTGGFIIPFVRELARMKRAERFDGRNAAACESVAAALAAAVADARRDGGIVFCAGSLYMYGEVKKAFEEETGASIR